MQGNDNNKAFPIVNYYAVSCYIDTYPEQSTSKIFLPISGFGYGKAGQWSHIHSKSTMLTFPIYTTNSAAKDSNIITMKVLPAIAPSFMLAIFPNSSWTSDLDSIKFGCF